MLLKIAGAGRICGGPEKFVIVNRMRVRMRVCARTGAHARGWIVVMAFLTLNLNYENTGYC